MWRRAVVKAICKAEVIGILVFTVGRSRRGERVSTRVLSDGRFRSGYLDTDVSPGREEGSNNGKLAVVMAIAVNDTVMVVVEIGLMGQLQLVVEVIMVL